MSEQVNAPHRVSDRPDRVPPRTALPAVAAPVPIGVAGFRQALRSVNARVRQGEVFTVMNRNRPVAVYGPPVWVRDLSGTEDVTLMDVRNRVAAVFARVAEGPLRVMEYGQCVGVLCPYHLWSSEMEAGFDKEFTVNEQQPEQQSLSSCPMTVLSFWNEAGGATKTTMVAEIGYVLSQRLNPAGQPNRVLLIDLDPQRSLTRRMGLLDPKEGNPKAERLGSTLFMAMQDPEGDLPDVMTPPVLTGLRVYPAHTQMRSLDAILINDDSIIENLRTVLQRFHGAFDYVLIDTPPSNGGLTRAALVASDYAVVPVPTQIKGIENIENVALVLGQCRRQNPDLKIACFVPTTYNANRKQDREVLNLLKSDFSDMALVTSVITERPAMFRNVVPGYTTVGCDTPQHEATGELNAVLSELLSVVGVGPAVDPGDAGRPVPASVPLSAGPVLPVAPSAVPAASLLPADSRVAR